MFVSKSSCLVLTASLVAFFFSLKIMTVDCRPVSAHQTELNKMKKKISKQSDDLKKAELRIKKLETKLDEIELSDSKEKLAELDISVNRIDTTNHIWRDNFKSVKEAFKNIRKQITIPKPLINVDGTPGSLVA